LYYLQSCFLGNQKLSKIITTPLANVLFATV
jgi:hypothetical protein